MENETLENGKQRIEVNATQKWHRQRTKGGTSPNRIKFYFSRLVEASENLRSKSGTTTYLYVVYFYLRKNKLLRESMSHQNELCLFFYSKNIETSRREIFWTR